MKNFDELQQAWQEAHDELMQGLAEMENAVNSRDGRRYRQCKRWVVEAKQHARQAAQALEQAKRLPDGLVLAHGKR